MGILERHYNDNNKKITDISSAVFALGRYYKEQIQKCQSTEQMYTMQNQHSAYADNLGQGMWNSHALTEAKKSILTTLSEDRSSRILTEASTKLANYTVGFIENEILLLFEARRKGLETLDDIANNTN